MVEMDRVIQRRYLLQRLVKQGQVCAIYQGYDQILQRSVTIKIVPATHALAYRAAIRMTSQFSHPNIVGIYDLIVEPENLYLVQEYVDGDDFVSLLQMQFTPYQVADMGLQICHALIYAGSASRKVCHGDLTPSSVMRDRRGQVRVNNFALPSDLYYFTSWSTVGSDGIILSDRELPWGQQSEGRRGDDARAVGLLLYQLLAGRAPGATSIEPPSDGRLRFLRNVPPELCEIVARTVVRQHPQHISTVENLHAELKVVVDALEPPLAMPASNIFQSEEFSRPRTMPSGPLRGTGNLSNPLPGSDMGLVEMGHYPAAYRPDMPGSGVDVAPAAPTIADMSLKLAAARQAAYPQLDYAQQEATQRRLNLPLLLLLGLLVFAAFFGIGYFVATAVFHP